MPSIDESNSVGDRGWVSVYEREAARLMRLASVLVGRDDAHDLVIDTMQRVLQHPNWSSVTNPGAYLSRSLVNGASQRRRSTRRRDQREAAFGRTPMASLDLAADVDVQRAMELLSPQQRAVAYLAYWEDMTIPDIAEWLGVGEGTVRRQLARAKDRLREVLR